MSHADSPVPADIFRSEVAHGRSCGVSGQLDLGDGMNSMVFGWDGMGCPRQSHAIHWDLGMGLS